MSSRRLLLALLLALPAAAAHGEAPATVFDPLSLSFHGYLGADGVIVQAAPEAGAVAFPASSPLAPGAPLRFAMAAPVRFSPGGGIEVDLTLRAEQAVLARDADGNALELTLEANGTPVEGASRRVPLDKAALVPGDTATARVVLQAPGATFDEGAPLALTVRALMPVGEGALQLVVGGETASRLDMPDMRVPSAADLRLQDAPLAELLLGKEAFRPTRADAAVIEISVGHGDITLEKGAAFDPNGTYVVLKGDETPEDAQAHAQLSRDARVAAAHEIRVGNVIARVHPGLAVVVPVTSAPTLIDCVRNCPEGGFRTSVTGTAQQPGNESAPRGSVLIPPPRDTRGIPVSEDAPEEKHGVPAPAVGALVVLVALAAFARARRG